jgi:hypothetical protein
LAWYNDPDTLYAEWARHGYNCRATARTHNVDTSTLSNRIKKLGFTKPHDADDHSEIIVEGDGLSLGDMHIPVTDWMLVDKAIRDAKKYGATDWLALPGDTLNQDATSRHEGRQSDAGIKAERESAKRFFDKATKIFKRVVLSKGNHDVRFALKLDNTTSFIDSIKMFLNNDKVEATGRDYILVDSPEGRWHLCHTRQYSRAQLTVPVELASKLHCHVIGYHRHHHAAGKSKCGRFWALEGGCTADAARTKYLKEWTTTFPEWSPGYWLLVDGKPYSPMLAPVPTIRRKTV